MIICGEASHSSIVAPFRSRAVCIGLLVRLVLRRRRSRRPDAALATTARLLRGKPALAELHPSLSALIEPRRDLLVGHRIELVDDLVLTPLDEHPQLFAEQLEGAVRG